MEIAMINDGSTDTNFSFPHTVRQRAQIFMNPSWLETHGQSHPKFETEGTSGQTNGPLFINFLK